MGVLTSLCRVPALTAARIASETGSVCLHPLEENVVCFRSALICVNGHLCAQDLTGALRDVGTETQSLPGY